MNTYNNSTTTTAIKLNAAFLRLVTGAVSVGDIHRERTEARAAQLAREDAIARRRCEWAESRNQFFATLVY